MSKFIKVLSFVCFLLVLYIIFVKERWTTPAIEIRLLLAYYKQIDTIERACLKEWGRYASLQDLLKDKSNVGKYRLKSPCQEGYCFHVSASPQQFTIQIVPEVIASRPRRKMMSLFADETGTIRVSYGSSLANANSSIVSQEELKRFLP